MGKTESPDIDAARLQELAARIQSAQARVANAERALAKDKAGRNLLARMADAVSGTPAETALAAARAELAAQRDAALSAAQAWLDLRTRHHLAQDRVAPPWSAAMALRYVDLQALLPRLRIWHALATDTIAVMERGAKRCEPLGDQEFHQRVWSARPSLFSIGMTQAAEESVADAIEAAARFRAVLPEEELSVDLDGLDDVFRRLVDYLRQPFLFANDWSEVNRHARVADKLALAAQMLRPLTIHLGQLADRADLDIARNAEQAEPFLAAYRATAWDELPAVLKGLVNERGSGSPDN